MANDKQLVSSFQSENANTAETIYPVPATATGGTLITAVSVANSSGTDRTYKAYIVNGIAQGTLPQVPIRTVIDGKTDIPVELLGQVIPFGGTLQFESSAATSIDITVSGRELT